MSATMLETQNYFDQWVASVPGPFQGPLRSALSPLESLVEQLTGDPDALVAAADVWRTHTPTIDEVFASQERSKQQLLATWRADEATANFDETLALVEEAATELVAVMEQTGDFLVESAEMAVAAFNAAIDIIVTALLFLAAKYIVAAATSVISFGASIAAAIADTFATFAITASRVLGVIARLQPVFTAIANFFRAVSVNVALYGGLIQTLQRSRTLSINTLRAAILSAPIHTGLGTGAVGQGHDSVGSLAQLVEEAREAADAADR